MRKPTASLQTSWRLHFFLPHQKVRLPASYLAATCFLLISTSLLLIKTPAYKAMGKQDTMNSCDMKLLICAQGKHLTQFNYKLEVTLLCRGRRFSTYSFSSTTHIGGGEGEEGDMEKMGEMQQEQLRLLSTNTAVSRSSLVWATQATSISNH